MNRWYLLRLHDDTLVYVNKRVGRSDTLKNDIKNDDYNAVNGYRSSPYPEDFGRKEASGDKTIIRIERGVYSEKRVESMLLVQTGSSSNVRHLDCRFLFEPGIGCEWQPGEGNRE